jgi:prostaglandin-endoperoxide synthase 2
MTGSQPGWTDQALLRRWRRVDHDRLIARLIGINRKATDRMPGIARRAQHRKHHGCVKATFVVNKDVPQDLRHGLFKAPGRYEAWIRFSNGLHPDDRKADSHGMAIKVLGVAGPKPFDQLNGPETAQDFLLADNETFPTGDPKALVRLNRVLSREGAARKIAGAILFLTHARVAIRAKKTPRSISSVLDTAYFSAIPYRLGDQAVKYVVLPRGRADAGAAVDRPDGLAVELSARLDPAHQGQTLRFDFGVDVRTDRDAQPIEDPSVPWSRVDNHRRELIATIEIAPQEVARGSGFAENLAFNPWHTLVEHQPLGYLSRTRRDVYRTLARHRHERNAIVPAGASDALPEYAHSRPRKFSKLYWDAPRMGLRRRLAKVRQDVLRWGLDTFPSLVRPIDRLPPLRKLLNRGVINYYSSQTVQRPLPLSLRQPLPPMGSSQAPLNPSPSPGQATSCSACVSWPGLTDRAFTGRHLPPMEEADFQRLPAEKAAAALFQRTNFIPADRSNALFCFFAQWLSDSFLRTHPKDQSRNTSSHELDLCQIYGLGPESTRCLRQGEGGRLKSRQTEVGEMPPWLVSARSGTVKREFEPIAFDPIHATSFDTQDPPHGRAANLQTVLSDQGLGWAVTGRRWLGFYAGGLERANSTLLYSAFNTLFLREHNRLAGELCRRYCTDDDDWLFETARNINLVKYLKILIEDYINHLSGGAFKVRIEPGFADTRPWYRTNRITLEFNLLYRWHSLVPNAFDFEGRILRDRQFRFNNCRVEKFGIERIINAASKQQAGRVGLYNTPRFLLEAELKSIQFSRKFRLAGFNAYRKRWGLKPYRRYEELTGTGEAAERLAATLRGLYGAEEQGGLDRLELPVGLFAEQRTGRRVLPILLAHMVASDAFSHALTNPLLASYIHGEDSLTEFGLAEMDRVSCLNDIARDNRAPGMVEPEARFEWRPQT